MYRRLIGLISFFLLLGLTVNPVLADTLVQDDFEGASLNTDKWQLINGPTSTITQSGGRVYFDRPNLELNYLATARQYDPATTPLIISGSVTLAQNGDMDIWTRANIIANTGGSQWHVLDSGIRINFWQNALDQGSPPNLDMLEKTPGVWPWDSSISEGANIPGDDEAVDWDFIITDDGITLTATFTQTDDPTNTLTLTGTTSTHFSTNYVTFTVTQGYLNDVSITTNAIAITPVAYWRLDEGSGSIAEDSVGTYDGILKGGPTWVSGVINGALEFDGGNDCIEIGNYPVFSAPEGSFSVALWANISSWSGEWANSMLGNRSDGVGWCLRTFGGWWASQHPDTYTMPTTALCFTTRGIGHDLDGVEDTPSNTEPKINEWTHIVCVYDQENNKKYIYFDGVEDAVWDTNPDGTITAASQRFYIGARSNSGDTAPEAYFNGRLDDVRFYDIALTADDVSALATPPVSFKAKDPVPADGADMIGEPLVLEWTPAGVATIQNVYLGTSPTLGAADLVSEGQTTSTYEYTSSLQPETTYYWRIDAIGDDGIITYTGNVWSFTTGPTTAYFPDPEDGYLWTPADVVLSWIPGVGSVSNDVYFGTSKDDVAAGTGDTSKGNQPEAAFDPGVLENDTPYYWRIDAVQADGTIYTGDVWRFRTVPETSEVDPDLVGWWTLNEGQGTIAYDGSLYGNNGTIKGNPQWVGGIIGGALAFDGAGDYVDCGNAQSLVIRDSITMTVWFKTPGFTRDWEAVIAKGDGAYRLSRSATTGNALHMGVNGTSANYFDGSRTVTDNEWHLGAGVYDHVAQRATLYVDGLIDVTTGCSGQIAATNDAFYIGENSGAGSRFFGGLIDDVKLYKRALSQQEIQAMMVGDTSKASNPVPADSTKTDIENIGSLTWVKGSAASQHDVYFSTDMFDVTIVDATDTTGVYRGRQAAASFTPAEGYQWGQNYYWRIDEVNNDGTITKGDVWSLTVTDYLIVEDFEDYNDYPPNEIWSTWIDGYENPANGSTAGYPEPDFNIGEHYLETTIVHSGNQSFPLFYDNSAGISEVTKTLTSLRNWTIQDVTTLTLWYQGNQDNAAETMFIALNGNAVVINPDANAAKALDWVQWDIPLTEFSEKGVNLSNVNSISLGFGNKANPTAGGGSGHVFFDDLRLYR